MKNEILINVGANIKRIIKEKNLKTRKIAEACNMEPETLRKYCLGKFEMGITKAVKIAKALDVEIGELFKDISGPSK